MGNLEVGEAESLKWQSYVVYYDVAYCEYKSVRKNIFTDYIELQRLKLFFYNDYI